MKIQEVINALAQLVSIGGADVDTNIDHVELRISTKTTYSPYVTREEQREPAYYVHFEDTSKQQLAKWQLAKEQMVLDPLDPRKCLMCGGYHDVGLQCPHSKVTA